MLSRQTVAMPITKYDTIHLGGGLDLVTPRLQLDPGAARRMVNYECGINGGYTRIKGYERKDGRTSPSSVTYTLLPMPTFLGAATVGTTITGMTSSSTGTIIAVGVNYLAVANVLGAGFQQDEMTTVAGVVIGKIGPHTVRLSKTLRKQYVNLAADVLRAFIQAVPGSGPIRGVFGAIFNGAFNVYAFRDEQVECRLWKASSSGWVLIPTGLEMSFKSGTAADGQPPDGSVITITGPPLENMICLRIITESGSWEAGTATGRVMTNTYATVSGDTFAIGNGTLMPTSYPTNWVQYAGGSYAFDYGNFGGRVSSGKIYGCDGTNRCFEFDGTTIVPLATTANPLTSFSVSTYIDPLDKPSVIKVHQNHLFVAIGSSVLHSGIGTPHTWTALSGAGEMATGDTVTGFKVLPGAQGSGAMAVTGRNQVKVLYGTALAGPEPFDLVNFESETGAVPNTIQTLDRVYYMDDRGVIDFKTAQEYGNFAAATVTRHIQPFMELKSGRAVCSTVHRGKNQYRVFFLDGTGLYLTLDNGKLKGCAPVAFPHQMTCAWSGEDPSGVEHTYLGSRDGFVYEMERGTSFDGDPIDADVLLNWDAMGTPRQRKSYRGASLEFSEETDYVELRVAARLGPHVTAHHQEDEATRVSGSELDMQWDHFTWGNGWYDGQIMSPMTIPLTGTAERMQYRLVSSSDYLDSYTLTSIITRYFPRRGAR